VKLPKKFTSMTLDQQENYLIDKLKKNLREHDKIKRMLGKVRGGFKFEVSESDSPETLEKEFP